MEKGDEFRMKHITLDIVDKINDVEVGKNDKPVKNIVIESIRVDTKGEDYKRAKKIK